MEILELKSVIIEIKESVDELNSRMEGEKRNNASGICGSVQKVWLSSLASQKERRMRMKLKKILKEIMAENCQIWQEM